MFSGGSYVDKEGFFDNSKGVNKLDVTDINAKRPIGTLGQAGQHMMKLPESP